MATRTAPVYGFPPSYRAITLHMIDASGDTFTQRLMVASVATATAIEAWISLYQTISNASIYKITDELVREGNAFTSNATVAYRAAAESGINLAFKDAGTMDTFVMRVVAPVPTVMQGSNDVPLLTNADMIDFLAAVTALAPGYNFKSAQYTTRRERNNNPKLK